MSVRRFVCASFLILSASISVLHAETSSEMEAEEINSSEPVTPPSRNQFSQSCVTGMLFIGNRFIEAPYQISCTADSIILNGETIFVGSESEESQSQQQSRRNPKQRQRNAASAAQFARQIFRTLDDDFAVVLLNPQAGNLVRDEVILLDRDVAKYALFSSVLTKTVQGTKVDFDMSDQQWERVQPLMTSVDPSAAQKSTMQNFIDQIDQMEAEVHRQHVALQRLDTFAYPLTIVAMVLGVFAFGHMLKWAGTTLANSDTPDSPRAIRYVEIGLLLMLGMSAIDLVWTLLAAQAGMMQELNPIAAHFVKSPMQLTIFKLLATGLGCGILYAFRNRAQMQQATWWMCLVTVLLTFRWVVFDSMMHS